MLVTYRNPHKTNPTLLHTFLIYLHNIRICIIILSYCCSFLTALPPAPHNISIEPLSSTSLSVQWPLLAPVTAEYGTILQYSIVCSAQNLTGHHRIEIAGRNTTQLAVTTLNPYTTYNCCVSAANLAGDGVPTCGEENTYEDGEIMCEALFSGHTISTHLNPMQCPLVRLLNLVRCHWTQERYYSVGLHHW